MLVIAIWLSWRPFSRFDDRGPFFMHAVVPYTVRCMRLALIFHFSLAFRLISTRSTNRLELEYLYYVPFCNVFSSGDALHQALVHCCVPCRSDRNRARALQS